MKYESKAYHCLIIRQVTETFTYFFGDHNLKKSKTIKMQVSRLECQSMVKLELVHTEN